MTHSRIRPGLRPILLARFAFVALCAHLQPARAEAQRQWSVEIDNDAVNAGRPTDVDYTQGLRLRLLGATASPVGRTLFGRIPGCASTGGGRQCQDWGLTIAQEIYTPVITHSKPTPGDRAYAGWLGATMQTRIHGQRTVHGISLTVGITGAPSLAEISQTAVHRAIGSPRPAGWSGQLGAEPTLNVGYEGSIDVLRSPASAWLGWRVTPRWAASVGTVHREAEVGVEGALELGGAGASRWRQSGHAGPASGLYLVGVIRARAVAGNLFLDGGFFRSGVSVGHLPVATVVVLGAGLRAHGVGLEWRLMSGSREYATQERPHAYTTIAMTL